jgi:hypothetical protein
MGGRPPAMEGTANILNKQLRTNDKGWSSSFGVGCGAYNPSPKKNNLLRIFKKSLGPGRIPKINDRIWIWDLGPGVLGVCIGRATY